MGGSWPNKALNPTLTPHVGLRYLQAQAGGVRAG